MTCLLWFLSTPSACSVSHSHYDCHFSVARLLSSEDLAPDEDYLNRILQCRQDIHVQGRLSRFMFTFPHFSLQKKYLPCITTKVLGGYKGSRKGSIVSSKYRQCERYPKPNCTRPHQPRHQLIKKSQCLTSDKKVTNPNPYLSCIKRLTDRVNECSNYYHTACSQAEVLTLKVIRLAVAQVRGLLQRNPSLKIVHLVRDPRGIILSRKLAYDLPRGIAGGARHLCQQMREDLQAYHNISRDFPQSILQIRYEDMANSPMEMLETLYKYLNKPVPDRTRLKIYRETHATSNGGTYGTSRKNSTQTANKWQRQLRKYQIDTINRICQDVITNLRYPILTK